MERTLISTEKIFGKFVALKGHDDSTVVGVGKNPEEVLRDAKKKGFSKPYILYVPEKGKAHVHKCL